MTHSIYNIDFVNRTDDENNRYRSVQCTATHQGGQSFQVQGQQRGRGFSVNLKSLLEGAEGTYNIQCTAILEQSGDTYQTELEAVKFKQGEFGSEASEYDENQFAYGVKVPSSKNIMSCYDKPEIEFQERCLQAYYGQQKYYLDVVDGSEEVQYLRQRYVANVGISLENNPKYEG